MTTMKIAEAAAEKVFNEYLLAHRSTATMYVPGAVYVPDAVVAAAKKAFAEAGGVGEIDVVGRGNHTHPVCEVSVRRPKSAWRK